MNDIKFDFNNEKPYTIYLGDCIDIMKSMKDCSVDSIVTDPPYELGFMGKAWDASGIANSVEMWREALRVLKPGGHLLAFSGSRTYHRMTCAIEDAGFDVRDQIMWVYSSGFPKSLDVSKAIDKAAGVERAKIRIDASEIKNPPNLVGGVNNGGDRPWRVAAMQNGFHEVDSDEPATDAARQWDGWGTALKPAHEPICVARKPLAKGCTVAANVLAHGTGALNIDGCRVGDFVNTTPSGVDRRNAKLAEMGYRPGTYQMGETTPEGAPGRWPANIILDGSEEVVAGFPVTSSGAMKRTVNAYEGESATGFLRGRSGPHNQHGDTGSAARFFYCAKASKADRGSENIHPTVKPTDLMAYLVRLVTPIGGIVLDPFMGSGSTGKAAMREGMKFVGIDVTPEYHAIAKSRIDAEIESKMVKSASIPQMDLFAGDGSNIEPCVKENA